MSIFKNIVRGASTQFGREFGRAGANIILKGKNAYHIKTSSSDYTSRVNKNDSDIVRLIKGIKKIKFSTTDKSNIVRLLEMQNDLINTIEFKDLESIKSSDELTDLIAEFNSKYQLGISLIEKKDLPLYNDLKNNELEIENKISQYNKELKNYIERNYQYFNGNKKDKKTAILLTLPLLGLQWFYFKEYTTGVLSILLFILIIPIIINFVFLIKLIVMSEDSFNNQFNSEYSFFNNLMTQIE
jgi:TM2 domain-containing membrane protein YozV